MIKYIKEDITNDEKQSLIKKYEDKVNTLDSIISNIIEELNTSIEKSKSSMKYNIITEEISSFYVDEKNNELDSDMLYDDIESEQLSKEIDKFVNMSDDEIKQVIKNYIIDILME